MFVLDETKHPPVVSGRLRLVSEVSHLALAKYQLIRLPRDPMRLTEISSLLTSLDVLATPPSIILMFFSNNVSQVTSMINYLLLGQ